MRKITAYLTAAALAGAALAASCSSDDDTATSLSMTGTIDYELPAYTVRGQHVELEATGIVAPSDVAWVWYSRSLEISDIDTVYGRHLSVVIPDRLGQDTLVAYAKKDGYYSASTTKYTQVFDPVIGGESIEGVEPGDSFFTDPRDGVSYPYKKYGRLDWFTMNLRYSGQDGDFGAAYHHSDSAAILFGRLYSWDEATGGQAGHGLGCGPRGACPDGWSVPTREDWTDFANAVRPAGATDSLVFDDDWNGLAPAISAPIYINGEKMWEYSPDNIQTNAFKWNAIPTGKSSNAHTSFEQILTYAFWWVADLSDDGRRGFFRYIYWNYPDLPYSSADKENIGFSVRCVRISK